MTAKRRLVRIHAPALARRMAQDEHIASVVDPSDVTNIAQWARDGATTDAPSASRATKTIECVMEKIIGVIPKRSTAIADRVLTWYIKGSVRTLEDLLTTIPDYINDFNRLSRRRLISNPDIGRYRTWTEFARTVERARELEASRPSARIRRDDERRRVDKDTEYLYEDDSWLILVPLRRESSVFWGKGTRWCISATKSTNMFEFYVKRYGHFVFVISKTSRNKWAIITNNNSVWDENDNEICPRDIPYKGRLALLHAFVRQACADSQGEWCRIYPWRNSDLRFAANALGLPRSAVILVDPEGGVWVTHRCLGIIGPDGSAPARWNEIPHEVKNFITSRRKKDKSPDPAFCIIHEDGGVVAATADSALDFHHPEFPAPLPRHLGHIVHTGQIRAVGVVLDVVRNRDVIVDLKDGRTWVCGRKFNVIPKWARSHIVRIMGIKCHAREIDREGDWIVVQSCEPETLGLNDGIMAPFPHTRLARIDARSLFLVSRTRPFVAAIEPDRRHLVPIHPETRKGFGLMDRAAIRLLSRTVGLDIESDVIIDDDSKLAVRTQNPKIVDFLHGDRAVAGSTRSIDALMVYSHKKVEICIRFDDNTYITCDRCFGIIENAKRIVAFADMTDNVLRDEIFKIIRHAVRKKFLEIDSETRFSKWRKSIECVIRNIAKTHDNRILFETINEALNINNANNSIDGVRWGELIIVRIVFYMGIDWFDIDGLKHHRGIANAARYIYDHDRLADCICHDLESVMRLIQVDGVLGRIGKYERSSDIPYRILTCLLKYRFDRETVICIADSIAHHVSKSYISDAIIELSCIVNTDYEYMTLKNVVNTISKRIKLDKSILESL